MKLRKKTRRLLDSSDAARGRGAAAARGRRRAHTGTCTCSRVLRLAKAAPRAAGAQRNCLQLQLLAPVAVGRPVRATLAHRLSELAPQCCSPRAARLTSLSGSVYIAFLIDSSSAVRHVPAMPLLAQALRSLLPLAVAGRTIRIDNHSPRLQTTPRIYARPATTPRPGLCSAHS